MFVFNFDCYGWPLVVLKRCCHRGTINTRKLLYCRLKVRDTCIVIVDNGNELHYCCQTQQELTSCWDGRPFTHNRHAPKIGDCFAPFRGGRAVRLQMVEQHVLWGQRLAVKFSFSSIWTSDASIIFCRCSVLGRGALPRLLPPGYASGWMTDWCCLSVFCCYVNVLSMQSVMFLLW